VIVSSSVNRLAFVVAVLLAAAIVWFGISTHDLLLSVFGIALLVVGPFVRRPESAGNASGLRGQVDQLQPMPAAPPPYPASAPSDPSAASGTSIPAMSPQVLAQLAAGNKIGAIKRYREEYGVGLKEAKDTVDEFERQRVLPR
jgi:hypothetical protein